MRDSLLCCVRAVRAYVAGSEVPFVGVEWTLSTLCFVSLFAVYNVGGSNTKYLLVRRFVRKGVEEMNSTKIEAVGLYGPFDGIIQNILHARTARDSGV